MTALPEGGESMAIITISRGTFTGGKILADRLGTTLHYPVLSREEALAEASKSYGISEEEVASALGEPPHFWQQVPGKRIAYLKCFTAVLLERARSGNLIYHGNAGHLLIGGISHVLRVRVIADIGFRIEAAMNQLKCGRDEAIAHIEKVDKKRRKWAQFLYGVEWDDPALYDAVLNLERIGIVSSCMTISRMVELGDFKVTAASSQAQEDLLLSCKVWIALAKDEHTKTALIHVAADRGKVTVRGNAGSGKVIDTIPTIAGRVPGVKEVATEVGVGSDWYW
jgi:cytidylate kinase